MTTYHPRIKQSEIARAIRAARQIDPNGFMIKITLEREIQIIPIQPHMLLEPKPKTLTRRLPQIP
jgi:hypothetical protein